MLISAATVFRKYDLEIQLTNTIARLSLIDNLLDMLGMLISAGVARKQAKQTKLWNPQQCAGVGRRLMQICIFNGGMIIIVCGCKSTYTNTNTNPNTNLRPQWVDDDQCMYVILYQIKTN